jgi:hypothetical protein
VVFGVGGGFEVLFAGQPAKRGHLGGVLANMLVLLIYKDT